MNERLLFQNSVVRLCLKGLMGCKQLLRITLEYSGIGGSISSYLSAKEWLARPSVDLTNKALQYFYRNESSMLHSAIGGTKRRFDVCFDDSILTIKMVVDYVRIFQLAKQQ